MKFLQKWAERSRRSRQILEGDRLREDGRLREALAVYRATCGDGPEDAPLLRTIAEIQGQLGDADGAASTLLTLLDLDLNHADLLSAATFDEMRETPAFLPIYGMLIARLREHLANHPEDSDAAFSLGGALEIVRDTSGAQEVYARLAAESPAEDVRGRAHYARAWLFLSTGAPDQAASALRAAFGCYPQLLSVVEADPAFADALASDAFKGVVDFGIGALADHLRAQASEHPDNSLPLRQLVHLFMAHGMTEAAADAARSAMAAMPSDMGFVELYANALFDLDRLHEAREVYNDLLRQSPNHASALYRTGVLYEREDNTDAAREAFWDALRVLREECELAFLIARGCARIGDEAGALAAIERAADASRASDTMPTIRLLEAVERSPDLDPLRELPDFQGIVASLESDAVEPSLE